MTGGSNDDRNIVYWIVPASRPWKTHSSQNNTLSKTVPSLSRHRRNPGPHHRPIDRRRTPSLDRRLDQSARLSDQHCVFRLVSRRGHSPLVRHMETLRPAARIRPDCGLGTMGGGPRFCRDPPLPVLCGTAALSCDAPRLPPRSCHCLFLLIFPCRRHATSHWVRPRPAPAIHPSCFSCSSHASRIIRRRANLTFYVLRVTHSSSPESRANSGEPRNSVMEPASLSQPRRPTRSHRRWITPAP